MDFSILYFCIFVIVFPTKLFRYSRKSYFTKYFYLLIFNVNSDKNKLCNSLNFCTNPPLHFRITYYLFLNCAQTIYFSACNEKLNASLGVPYVGSDRKVKFNCSILTSTLRTDVQYSVTWTIDGFPLKSKNGIALVSALSSYERVAIFDTINLQGNLNKMVCTYYIFNSVFICNGYDHF